MNNLALATLIFFGSAFVLKLALIGYGLWRGRIKFGDDEDGPVSGWGTPKD